MAINSDTPIGSTGIPGWSSTGIYETGAQGSDGMHPGPYPGGGEPVGTVPVTRPYDSVAAGVPQVTQFTTSTTSAIDPMKDVVSGAVTPVAAPPGHVVSPHHPNSGH